MSETTERPILSGAVTMKATLLRRPVKPKSEDWRETAFHWRVFLSCDGRTMETDFYCGAGWVEKLKPYQIQRNRSVPGYWKAKPKPPTSADVLSSLIMGANSSDSTFPDFCADMGYSEDSRKALETYLQCQDSGVKVRALLGPFFGPISEELQDY